MKPNVNAALCFFLLFAGLSFRGFAQSLIVSDAAGGIFTEDQKPSFELAAPGSLRLLVDGREIYRGAGPAYPELGAHQGEERGFTLAAERYSPEGALLESLSWYIYIDKRAPLLPDLAFRDTEEGLRLAHSEASRLLKIRAWADIEGDLAFFSDIGEAPLALAGSFSALAWAEDLAGNISEIRSERFEIPPVKIENPVPGEWLNLQMLAISGAGGKEIYWTADGTNPLEPGGTGRLYRGPERIEKSGSVKLRIAWRDFAGRVREDEVDYRAGGELPNVSGESGLSALAAAEESPIDSRAILAAPASFLWSMGGVPRLEGGVDIALRPEALVKRSAALHLSAEGGAGGIYRFAYLLDGTGEEPEPSPVPDAPPLKETVLAPGAAAGGALAEQGEASLPRMVSAGRNRLILWPKVRGTLYFSWSGGSWRKAESPFPVPLGGGTLRWFALAEEGSSVSGPHGVALPPLPGRPDKIRGRIACRAYEGNRAWDCVSDVVDYVPGMLQDRSLDVCDGEDLEWAFIRLNGSVLEQSRRDRLAPPAPEFAAPAEGSWNRGPVKVGVVSGEEGAVPSIDASLRYASGTVELYGGFEELNLAAFRGQEAEVELEAFLEDASGNRSRKATRRFILDPETIYVSPKPLLTPPESRPAEPRDPGSRYDPFVSLEEALDFALKENRRDIRVAGTLELRTPVTVSRSVRIDGGWRGTEKAALIFGDDFFWTVGSGGSLELSGIAGERKNGSGPLIRAERDSRLEISASEFGVAGPFLAIDGAACEISDSRIAAKISGDRRLAAFSARESAVQIDNSRIRLEGDSALVFDVAGGGFAAANSVFLSSGGRAASVFVFNGTRGELTDLALSSSARDYASVLEVSNSELILAGGKLEAAARAAAALLLDKSASMVYGAEIAVEGGAAAKALEIRGTFPWVQDCSFSYRGTAKKAEVFSGTSASAPYAGSVTGNRFAGFAAIWGAVWPMDAIQDFNKTFSSPLNPNAVEGPPAPPEPSGNTP